MDPAQFILNAGYGDEEAAREALREDPGLARARNETGVSVIATSVYAGRIEFARELARRRDDLDLFEAACIGDVARVASLLEEAEPGAIDRIAPDGFSAIGFAAYFGHVRLLDFLLEAGADFESPSRNAMRVRPLHSAVAHSEPATALVLARRLLEAGADPNSAQDGGFRPLHEAVLNAHLELVELLLAFGANPHVSNDEGDSPLQLALAKGMAEIVARMEAMEPDRVL